MYVRRCSRAFLVGRFSLHVRLVLRLEVSVKPWNESRLLEPLQVLRLEVLVTPGNESRLLEPLQS